jgi:hypothetical protein
VGIVKRAWWVGCKDGKRKCFGALNDFEPTQENTGYTAVIGPFRTQRGAKFCASWRGINNPHIQTAQDGDRIARMLQYDWRTDTCKA